MASASSDLDLARGKLREAAECWQQVGARYDEARARVDLGVVLRDTGEIDAAEIQLQRALDAFEGLTATFDVVRVTELLGRAAPQSRVVRTFMFTDIEDSTTLLATMGDDRWSEVLRWHDSTLRRLFDRYDGQEIKQRGGGDGFFVAFASAVGVLVIVWTLIGASPPTGTEPIMICRDLRRSISRQGRMDMRRI